MRYLTKTLIISFCILLFSADVLAREWWGTIPLHSTRADVKKLFGRPLFEEGKPDDHSSYLSEMRTLYRKTMGCPSEACSVKLTPTKMAEFLQNNPNRPADRYGNPILNFDDYMAFHKAYGNALGRLFTIKVVNNTILEKPGQFFIYPESETLVILDKEGGEGLRQEVSVTDVAEDLVDIMSAKGTDGKNGQKLVDSIDIDEFAAHMTKWKFVPDGDKLEQLTAVK